MKLEGKEVEQLKKVEEVKKRSAAAEEKLLSNPGKVLLAVHWHGMKWYGWQ